MTTEEVASRTETTAEVANRLVDLCRMEEYETATRELYADDCVSNEPTDEMGPKVVSGIGGILGKLNRFKEALEERRSNIVSNPVIAGNFFSVSFDMDVTMKGMGRQRMTEIAVYEVKDGKIASEHFFYN